MRPRERPFVFCAVVVGALAASGALAAGCMFGVAVDELAGGAPRDAGLAEAPEPPVDAGPDAPPVGFLSPSNIQFGAFAMKTRWTLAADRRARVYYTLDGTEPTPEGPSAPSPFTLPELDNGTRIRWFVSDGLAGIAQQHQVVVRSELAEARAYVADQVSLDGAGPVLRTTAGATVSVTFAYRFWAERSCPTCVVQLVYGFDDAVIGCVESVVSGAHPGREGKAKLDVMVPEAPGAHMLRLGIDAQFSCDNAIKANLLRGAATDVALVIVE